METKISKEQLTTLFFIHYALMFGIFSFMSVVYFFLLDPAHFDQETYDMFIIVVPIVAIGSYFMGSFLFKKMINGAKEKSPEDRLQVYQTALIVQDATLEGPALLAIVASLLSCSITFLGIALILLFLMYLKRPTEEKINSLLS